MVERKQIGKFELIRRIGAGGVGEVYEAVLRGAAGFSKRVALKLLLPDVRREPEIVSMFIDEARIASTLNHPNIVDVYEFGEIDDTYYMAMEFVEGRDLRDYMLACRRAGRPFPLEGAIYVIRELCRGLQHIHSANQQIVHRDVTPKNIFLTPEGRVQLGDFGIAQAQGRLTRTQHGRIKGTLTYLAPEQTTGEPVTARTDVYAAGLVLFELLTGRSLIQGRTEAEMLFAAMNPPRVVPSSIRAEAAPLDAVVARALEKHPTLRYPSAAHLANELDRFLPAGSGAPASLLELLTANTRRPTAPPAMMTAAPPPSAARSQPADKETTPYRRQRAGSATGTRRLAAEVPPTGRRQSWAIGGVLVAAIVVVAALLWTAPWTASTTTRGSRTISVADSSLVRPAPLPASSSPRPSDAGSSPDTKENLQRDASERPRSSAHKAVDRTPRRARKPRRRRTARSPAKPPAGNTAPGGRAGRSPQTATSTSPAASSASNRDRLRRRLLAAVQAGKARGLWPGDDGDFDREVTEADRQLDASELDGAARTIERVERRAASFIIDRRFVQRKMDRLDRAIEQARLSPAQQKELAGETQSIVHLMLEGDLITSSAEMSRLRARLAASH